MIKLNVVLVSDLFNVGRQEDGVPFVGERYFAELEDSTGRRWRHRVSADGAVNLGLDEDGYGPYFQDTRAEATARIGKLVARVAAHLAAGGKVDFDHWYEVDPAYGSDAYVGQGIEARRVWEERNNGEAA